MFSLSTLFTSFFLIFLYALAILSWIKTGDSQLTTLYTLFLQCLNSFIASLFCFLTMSLFDKKDVTRYAWQFFALGLLCWGLGSISEISYYVITKGNEMPFPWYADFGYLMLAPFMIFGLRMMHQSLNAPIPQWGILLSVLLYFVSVGAGVWLNFRVFVESTPLANQVVTVCYLILDPLLLSMTVATASVLGGGLLARAGWLVVIGLIIFYIGDVLFIYFHNIHQPDAGGIWLDLSWPLAFGFITLAAATTRSLFKNAN